MSYCYDLSMKNFSSLYLENHYLSDKQQLIKDDIHHALKVGFSNSIKWNLDGNCEEIAIIRKTKFKLVRKNYDVLYNRLHGDGYFLTFKEMCQSTLKSDIEAVNFIKIKYPISKNKRTLVSFYVVGFYYGILYSVHRMNRICKGKGSINIEDSELPDFLKEYNIYTTKHTMKG